MLRQDVPVCELPTAVSSKRINEGIFTHSSTKGITRKEKGSTRVARRFRSSSAITNCLEMCPQFLEMALGASHCESCPNSKSQLPRFCPHLQPQISTHSAALPDPARKKVATWFEVAGEIGLGGRGGACHLFQNSLNDLVGFLLGFYLFYIPCSFPSYRRG